MEKNTSFTILIVEDDTFMLEALKIILEEERYKIFTAENGIEALDVLKQGIVPDLILLDMIMPKMDGWEFAKAYQQTYTKRSPIVVITGAADAAKRAEDVEAHSWMGKPYVIDELLKMVKKFSHPA